MPTKTKPEQPIPEIDATVILAIASGALQILGKVGPILAALKKRGEMTPQQQAEYKAMTAGRFASDDWKTS